MTQQKLTPSFNKSSLDKKQSICPSADDCYNAKQAAEIIGISAGAFSIWKKDGQVSPDHQHGKRDFYTKNLIDTYRTAYQTAKETPDVIKGNDVIEELYSKPFNPSSLQTSVDYNSEELYPFKAETKIIRALIISSAKKLKLLHLFLGMLIGLLIELLTLLQVDADMHITAYQLQDQYFQTLNFNEIQHNTQGFLNTVVEQKELSDQQKTVGSDVDNGNDEITAPRGISKITIWQKAVASAGGKFLTLCRLVNDMRLDREERDRAAMLLKKIFTPYRRLTDYIATFEKGTARHDVPLLILTRKPKEFGINSLRWSVRSLEQACKAIRTKKASRGTIGRILKELEWNFAIKPKLLSSDPNYGPILLHLGLIFNQLEDDDLVIFNDDFKYTSSKVAEYLKQRTLPNGMNTVPPFAIHKTFYKTKAAIRLTGLLCGKSRKLLLKELEDGTFDGYYKTLTALLDELILTKGDKGRIYLIIDNAPNHSPNVLRHLLLEKYNGSVEVLILPRYAPNHNLIERVWKFLLETSERCGNSEEELWTYLDQAKQKYDEGRVERELKLHCEICGKKWIFNKANREENEYSLKKHLCFRIEGFNPYSVYVLTHSLETLREIEDPIGSST